MPAGCSTCDQRRSTWRPAPLARTPRHRRGPRPEAPPYGRRWGPGVTVRVASLRFEHHREPLGIGESRPRLSWKVTTDVPNWLQAGYELQLLDQQGDLAWSSGRVVSAESVLVPWEAPELRSRDRRRARVRVWHDGDDGPSPWSDEYPVEAGLLRAGDWVAKLIGPYWDEDTSTSQPGPLLRREFELRGEASAARLYVTAHGVYELQLNGVQVGDHVFAPGWTSYGHRLRYQTFDVTGLLRKGPNVLGAM